MMSRSAVWRTVAGVGLGLVSAVLLLLALPPYGLWPLAIAALVPALVAQHRVLPPRLSSLGIAVAIGGFFALYFGELFGGLPGVAWPFRLIPLALLVLLPWTEAGVRTFHERTAYRWFVPHGAVVWVGIEAIRGLIPVLGTGAFVGYAYAGAPWLIQPVSLFGIYGLDLLTMLLSYTLGLGALALIDRRRPPAGDAPAVPPRLALGWLAASTLLAGAWTGLSLVQFAAADEPAPTVRVAALQPGPTARKEAALIALTRAAATQGAELVVWPEGALRADPQGEAAPALRALAAETGAYLVIPYGISTAAGLRNEATVLTPAGAFLGVYAKDHPLRWLGESGVSRTGYPTYATPLGRLATIICYDLLFTDTARAMGRGGAQVVLAPSNDWPALADQEYQHLVFRAIENRAAYVKADTAYDSAVVDPYGRLLGIQVTQAPAQALLLADVPLGRVDAPLIRLGDWVGWLCLGGLALFALAVPLTRRLAPVPSLVS
jgi:apolipoprotein N-acyltransferase